MTNEVEIVHCESTFLILNKPAGLLSVPGRGADKQDCLSQRVQAQFADACVVHRLDMATSGLLLMARGAAAQRHFNAAFAQRQVGKRYTAVVHGCCTPAAVPTQTDDTPWQTIDLPIALDWSQRPLRSIDYTQGKPSTTRWRSLGYDTGSHSTRLELEPITGRSHQLRLHLQAIGHPILGDHWYAPATIAERSPRLLLHAHALWFTHPDSGEALHFQCAPAF